MNSKKNILVLSPFFYPEPISTGKYNTDMVLALRDKGHHVTILCFHPFYPSWKVKKSNHDLENIKIIRGGKNLWYPKIMIFRRLILELAYSFFVLRKKRKILQDIDLIIPVFPPSLAYYVIIPFLNTRIRKVGLVHDLQGVYAKKRGGITNKFIGFFIRKIEKRAFDSCDKLIFLSNEMKEIATKQYSLKSQSLVTQYPFITIDIKHKTNNLIELFPNNKKHIVYAGALSIKQNPDKLYDLFNYCSNKMNNVMFHIFSQGKIFDKLNKNNTNPKIQFHNLVPKKNIEELYFRSTLQIIPQLPGTSKGSLPSKLPNLLISNCQILCITDKKSEIETLMNKLNLNNVVNNWDNELIKNKMQEILSSDTNLENKQLKFIEELFNMDSMINSILSSENYSS